MACRSREGSAPEPPPPALPNAIGPSADAQAVADSATAASSGPQPSNALGVSREIIDAVVNPMHLPAYAGPTGIVEGTVLVRGPAAPDFPDLDVHVCPAALDTYGKLFRAGPPRADGARPLADAIVVVTGYEGTYLPEKDEAHRVTIGAGCGYPTRTIDLTFGQRLEIANDSTVPFAPYIEGGEQLSVLIAPPLEKGEPAKIFPPRADHFVLRDQLQKFVRGDVYVLRQPLHAVSDPRGHFRIEGVPVGRLRVGAHLPALASDATAGIDVKAAGTRPIELALTYAPGDAGLSAAEASKAAERK